MTDSIGSVTKDRYDAIVAESRELVAQRSRIQFRIGDLALEVFTDRSYDLVRSSVGRRGGLTET
jgi:hypothetical protein